MDVDLAELQSVQSGVVSRTQALRAGLESHDIRRLLRRREWVAVHPGVYLDHTGDPSWLQRAWAATLALWPAALAGQSALRAANGPGWRQHDEKGPIQVAVDRQRNLVAPPGVALHRMSALVDRVQWHTSPARLRVEEAVIDEASGAAGDYAAIERVAAAVRARLTRPERILAALEKRDRIARRDFLTGVLTDVRDGTCSVLEHGYLTQVERPHGFPTASRQVKASSRGPIYRDVEYVEQRRVIELDGRLFHDTTQARDRDLDRDLDAAVEGKDTVRLGWGQVFDRPCQTASRIGALLQVSGWTGRPTTCPLCG